MPITKCSLGHCDGSGWIPCKDRAGNDASRPCECRASAPEPERKPQVVDTARRAAGDIDR